MRFICSRHSGRRKGQRPKTWARLATEAEGLSSQPLMSPSVSSLISTGRLISAQYFTFEPRPGFILRHAANPGRNVAVFSFTEMADEDIRAVVRRGIEIAARRRRDDKQTSALCWIGRRLPLSIRCETSGFHRRSERSDCTADR
jgi:hypothetical protein